MELDSSIQPGLRSRWPTTLQVSVAIFLPLVHIVILSFYSHRLSVALYSDYFQLASAMFASVACFLSGRRSNGIARSFWSLAGVTLALWFLGKCFLFYDQNFQ